MELTERAAYLKGLIEGLGIDEHHERKARSSRR